MRRILLSLAVAWTAAVAVADVVNPLRRENAPDPFTAYDAASGWYYHIHSDNPTDGSGGFTADRVVLHRSRAAGRLLNADESRVVYRADAADGVFGYLWAPEMHRAPNGKWYVYTSCTRKREGGDKRLLILEAKTDDPFDGFVFKSFPDENAFAIDPTVFTASDGHQYICYSQVKAGKGQVLQIREMTNPWTFGPRQAELAIAELPWELVPPYDKAMILEGAFFVQGKTPDALSIVYSANGCWSRGYCLGVLDYQGGDLCDAKSWRKRPQPVFKSGNGVFGPGHASFFRSPDGTELWVSYHFLSHANPTHLPTDRLFALQRFNVDAARGLPAETVPVRPGDRQAEPSATADPTIARAPDGTVWGAHASRFIFAPVIAFTNVDGAVRYEMEVVDDFHRLQRRTSPGPELDLSACWKDLPVGYVTVSCRALGANGGMRGGVQMRTFWKKAAFRGGYEPAKMSYALARTRMFDCFMNMKETRYLLENGRPDPSYPLNGYPSKMLSAVIVATVSQLESKGAFKDLVAADRPLLDLARKAADYLISDAVPAGNPLAHFTRTYAKEGSEYGRFAGKQDHIMLNYPGEAGVAFLRLYRFCGDKKYLEAAERIAGTFRTRQEPDGTWPLRQNAVTGEVQGPNRLIPMDVIELMEGLYAISGKEDWRLCADRAFAFVENGPLRNWNWEAQFEDGPSYPQPYVNLSNIPANQVVRYLLARFPGDAKRVEQARAILAYVEDQFIEWEPPYRHGRFPREGMSPTDDGSWKWWCRPFDDWMTPCALEQYACYVPVNASAANCAESFLAMARATGEKVWLDKARALGDSLTRMIEDDGFFNTWCVRGVNRFDDRYHTWLNCTLKTKTVLDQLAALSDAF